MALPQAPRVSAAVRLNRLPVMSVYRQTMWILGFLFFFDMGDINTLAFAAPAIMKSWHLSIAIIGYLTSGTFLGMFIGSTIGGWFSDRVGRKKALTLTTLWFAGFSLLNAFAWEPTGLFITRMLTGVGISAMTVVGITYISEMYPAKMRGSFQGWIMGIGLCGIPVTAYVARFFVPIGNWGWRMVFVWGALGILFPLFSGFLKESPRWFETRGRFAEADAILDHLESLALAETGSLPPVSAEVPARPHRGGYIELIAPAYLARTAMLLFTWICFTLGFYGFTSWVPTLLVAHGFSLAHSLTWSSAMSLAAVPGALTAGVVSDRWDRKWLIAAVALAIAICGIFYGTTFVTATIIACGVLVEFFVHMFSPLLYTYTAESYPTEIRNSGTGLAYGVGRLVNVFGPLIVVFLFNHHGYTSVFVYISVAWVLLALTVGIFGLKSRTLA
jgi:MFS transporter, putative metabolite:H+ symporter